MTTQVAAVEFTPDGLDVTYVRVPEDVRQNGLVWQHRVHVPLGSDYDDEVEAVTEAVAALLDDVLEDEDTAPPVTLPDEDEDQEEEGEDDDE